MRDKISNKRVKNAQQVCSIIKQNSCVIMVESAISSGQQQKVLLFLNNT